MKPQNLIYLVVLVLVSISEYAFCQISPVNAQFNFSPPSSVYLSDYTLPGSNKLQLMVNLNDENEDFLDVFLKVEIKGNGVILKSNPDYNYSPVTLNTGINMLSGSDIEQYLNPANMIITGLDPAEFIQTSILPEGMYTFCVTVVDFLRRDKELSMQSCNTATLLKNNPPTNISPQCGQPVVAGGVQNLQFQWQANHDNSIMAEYSLKIVEVLPGVSPNDAMLGANTPIVEGLTSTMNQILYGPDQPELEIGHTYAYRVDVEDMEGLTTFENDGIGEVCVFEYGYELGGTVDLIAPEVGGSMKGEGSTVFQWGGPSNARPGDPIYYRFKIVEVIEGQDPVEAMTNNGLVIDDVTDIAVNLSSYNYILEEDLGTEAKFAWQVEAYVDDQLIASSEVRPFGTRPFIDHFTAGGRRVEVLSVSNQDPENLAGRGSMQLIEGGAPTPVAFSGLNIGIYPSGNILEDGSMVSEIPGGLDIELESEDDLNAEFKATHVVLDTRELRLRGKVEWVFPLASTSTGGVAKVFSKTMDVDYNKFKIVDDVDFENQSFELLDPYGYVIELLESSKFIIRDDNVVVDMTGSVTLPDSYKTASGNKAVFPFENITDLEYFEGQDYSDVESFLIFEKDKVSLKPGSAIFDFSDAQSPSGGSSEDSWKGVYFPKFVIDFPLDFDASGQSLIDESFNRTFNNSDGSSKAWIDGNGITVNAASDENLEAKFNEFEGKYKKWKITLDEGSVDDSYISGFIKIPLLSDEEFAYTIPFSNDGLATGKLDEELDNYEVTMMAGDEQREMILTIHSATFGDQNKLNCSASLNWPFLNAHNGGPSDGLYSTRFDIFGDGNIGYDGANNMIPLNNTGTGRLGGSFHATVDSIGAGFADNSYFFVASLVVNLGNQLAGEKGVTRALFSTSKEVAEDIEIKGKELAGTITGKLGYLTGNIQIPDLSIVVPGIVSVKSQAVSFTTNDSIWGASFKGNIIVDVYKPKKFSISANVIVGHNPTSDIAFFYGELGAGQVDLKTFKNEDGSLANSTVDSYKDPSHFAKGVVTDTTKNDLYLKVGPIAFTSIRLKIFHNLEYTEDAKGAIVFQPVTAGNNSWGFGGGLGGQYENGKEFKMYLGGFGMTKNGNLETLAFDVKGTVMDDIDFNGSVLLMFAAQRYQVTAGVSFESPLCVETQIWVDVDIPRQKVVVDLGKRTQKINISQGGCVGIGGEGWFHIAIDEAKDSIGMELGLGFVARFEKKSDWYVLVPMILEARGVMNAKIGVGLFGNVSVEWMSGETVWYCRNIGVYLDAMASINVEINTPAGGDVIPIASVAIAGSAQLDIIPAPVTASGKLAGTVTILGVSASIEFAFSGLSLGAA
ncbi:hypothetical protein [Portibacter lacus]|uniref:Uncharacterized protein n=1 Tax=Portibacter lacus TaxID=1099794 RepID=A0AA37SJ05_9BACT|nr:hypothetical protein [Portibacter lacus]GLR15578.1 hypothetical protein GCM10007940_01930 [Portibacter lacus]